MNSASRLIVGGAAMFALSMRNHHRAIDGKRNRIPLLIIRLRE